MKKTKEKKFRLSVRHLVILAVLIFAAVYMICGIYYTRHLYGKDTIFGVKVKNKTVEQVKAEVEEQLKGYQLTLQTRTGKEVLSASDMDLAFADHQAVDQMKNEQKALLWIAGPFSKKEDLTAEVAYDQKLLKQSVDGLSCMDTEKMDAPKDAHLEYKDGKFQIVKETLGTTLDPQKVYAAITKAVENGTESLDLEKAGCYVAPEVYEDAEGLKKLQKEVNDLLDVTITYDFKDRKEVVDADLISQWITFGDDFSYELDKELVEKYEKELGYKYDTFGLSREFRTSSGKTITLKGGDYGWCIHKSKSADALIKTIKAGKDCTIEPVYLYSGKERAANDIGDTYIEVSIAQQRMWCYVDGKLLVDTPVVTGMANVADRATPSGGVWAIDARTTDYYLTGDDYRTHVNFWLPFNGNVGIHDATWRDSFGGDIYKTKGSHGCVNTPYENAKKIYEHVTIGTPVVVY